jgi:hypothetical protein
MANLRQTFFRFRALIIILAGVFCFLLGALYLSVERMDVGAVFVVTGSPRFEAEQPTAIRINAYYDILARDRRAAHVFLAPEAHFEPAGAPPDQAQHLRLSVSGQRPAIVRFALPLEAEQGGRLTLRVWTAGDPPRDLAVPIPPLGAGAVEASGVPQPPRREGDLALALTAEDGVFVHGLSNRLFVRVADGHGSGTPSRVTLTRGAQRERHSMAGRAGIAVFEIDDQAFRYSFRASAEDAAGRQGQVEADFDPVPRGRRLRVLPPVARPGHVVRVQVTSVAHEEQLHCDLLAGDSLVDSFSLSVVRGSGAHTLPAPRTLARYRVQCAPYYTAVGQTSFASRALVVTTESCPVAALVQGFEPLDESDRAYVRWLTEAASGLSEDERVLATDYLAARLVPPYVASVQLLSTLADDQERVAERRAALRARLLTALAGALSMLLLWAALLVGAHVIEVRRAARAFALEEAEWEGRAGPAELEFDYDPLPVVPGTSAGRVGGVLHFVVFVVMLALNALALIWLLGVVIR